MNTDIRLKVGFFNHTKIVRLKRRLGAEGVLSLLVLFAYTAQNKPSGDLVGMDAEDIEIASGWCGDVGAFVSVCENLKLIDVRKKLYSIHDWHTHQPWAAGADKRSQQARDGANSRGDKHEKKQPRYADSMPTAMLNDADSNAPFLSLPKNKTTPYTDTTYSLEFLSFYELYPKHTEKREAFKLWKTKVINGNVEKIMGALRLQIEAKMFSDEKQYIMSPRKWLHGDRWEDEIQTQTTGTTYGGI